MVEAEARQVPASRCVSQGQKQEGAVGVEIQDALSRLNSQLAERGMGVYKLAFVDLREVEHAPKNARFMTADQSQNLTQNIGHDGAMASVPLCWLKPDGSYRCLSGNHRIDSAVAAGVHHGLILYTDREITREEEVAIQLSHNAIVGQDDPVILADLWSEIEDVGLKCYAGLGDAELGQLAEVDLSSLAPANLDFRTLTFLFLPEEVDRLKQVFEIALEAVDKDSAIFARLSEFDRLLDNLARANAAYGIRNSATALMLILDVFERHLTDLKEGWLDESGEPRHKDDVPLASILGRDTVPTECGLLLEKAIQRMLGREELEKKSLWKALEAWATDYLEDEGTRLQP